MKNLIRSAAFLLLTAILFSACTSVPDHAKYIPNDAVIVVGLNTEKISKGLAWNAITGSKVLDDMKKDNERNAAKELDQSGIDWMSTSYAYVRSAPVQGSGAIAAGILPLEDRKVWETFVKKQFPTAQLQQVNGRTQVSMGQDMSAGWTDKVLIVVKALPNPQSMRAKMTQAAMDDAEDIQETDTSIVSPDEVTTAVTDTVLVNQAPATPVVATINIGAALDSAFAVTQEQSIVKDNRFTKLEKKGHDITIWMNYDRMMNAYMSNSMAGAMGANFSGILWKDAAMASGIDFKKGKITADMLYYTSEEMKEISKELSNADADKDMIDRLPVQHMNMLAAWHMSPKGTKAMLEKAGFLGLVNLAMMSAGISTDDIFDAFTGDMAVSVSDFSMQQPAGMSSSAGSNASFVYAMKIAKKENIDKLMGMAVSKELLRPAGDHMYQMAGGSANPFVLAYDDKYIVAASGAETALAYLQGKNKDAGKLPGEAHDAVYGHPMGMYLDVASLVKMIPDPMSAGPAEKAFTDEARKMISDISFYSSKFNGSAFESHGTVNFTNKEENSLLQLLQLAIKAKDMTDERSATAGMPPVVDSVAIPVPSAN